MHPSPERASVQGKTNTFNVQHTARQAAQVGTGGRCGDGTGSVSIASPEFGQGQGAVPHGEWRDRFDDAVLGRSIKLRADGLNRG